MLFVRGTMDQLFDRNGGQGGRAAWGREVTELTKPPNGVTFVCLSSGRVSSVAQRLLLVWGWEAAGAGGAHGDSISLFLDVE